MAHSKQFMLDEIARMVAEMQLALTHINAPENHMLLPEEAIKAPVENIREGYKWLVCVFEMRHRRWTTVRGLLVEEQWARYYLWGGFDNHREMIMLKEASLHLRQAVISRARPDLFKKSKLSAILKKQAKAKEKAAKANSSKTGKPKKQSKASQRTKKPSARVKSADEEPIRDGS
jgi:hypothetical protein